LRPAGDREGPRDMIEEQTPPGLVDSEMGPTRSGRRAFNQWLQVQLKAMKLTQRQLAQKSGVDHSTISRLTRGDRAPSLRTATLLARGLGMAKGLAWLDDQSLGRTGAPAARVEYALRSDDLLSETEVGKIMNVYLATRLRRPRSVATPAPMETTGTTPVPIVVQVPWVRPRSTSIGRLPTAARGRSS
jgi:transcriptional regulator with XRE-family HTH domain